MTRTSLPFPDVLGESAHLKGSVMGKAPRFRTQSSSTRNDFRLHKRPPEMLVRERHPKQLKLGLGLTVRVSAGSLPSVTSVSI